jgi:hypothetical protein
LICWPGQFKNQQANSECKIIQVFQKPWLIDLSNLIPDESEWILNKSEWIPNESEWIPE